MLQYCVAVSLCCNNAGDQRARINTKFQNKQKNEGRVHGFIMLTNNVNFKQLGSTQNILNSFVSTLCYLNEMGKMFFTDLYWIRIRLQ